MFTSPSSAKYYWRCLPTDREWHERRVVLQLVVLVQPTVRVESERTFPDRRVRVTLVEIGKDKGVLCQIVASVFDWFCDGVNHSSGSLTVYAHQYSNMIDDNVRGYQFYNA